MTLSENVIWFGKTPEHKLSVLTGTEPDKGCYFGQEPIIIIIRSIGNNNNNLSRDRTSGTIKNCQLFYSFLRCSIVLFKSAQQVFKYLQVNINTLNTKLSTIIP